MKTIETTATTMINDAAAEALRLIAAGEDGVQFVLDGTLVHVKPGMSESDVVGAYLTAKEPVNLTAEVRGDFVRRCSRCKKTEKGKAKSFHWSDIHKAWVVSEYEFPTNWISVHVPIFFSKTQEFPTHYSSGICEECKPAVLDFIGFRDPRTEERRQEVENKSERWGSL